MASRSMNYWKSMANRLKGNANYATSSSPKMKAYAPTAGFSDSHHHQQEKHKRAVKGEFVPVYVAIGMIVLSVSLGLITAKQQILHSPNVRVKKKKRESVPEVEDPDRVVDEAERFVKKSFFRKVAHVQEFDSGFQSMDDHIRRDPLAHNQLHTETLKSVGIDPKPH